MNIDVPQDYNVRLTVTVDNNTFLLIGLLVLGAIGYAKARK